MFCNFPGKRIILTWLCAQLMRLIYYRWDIFRCASISWFQVVHKWVSDSPFSASACTGLSELLLLWTETSLLQIWNLECYWKSSPGPWRFCNSPLPSKGWNYISPSTQDMDKLRWMYIKATIEIIRIFGIRNPWITKKLYTYGSVCAGREKWPFNVIFFLK